MAWLRSFDRSALLVAAGFLSLSLLWVWFSDSALALLVPDPKTRAVLQTVKGSAFVILSAAALYVTISLLNQRRDRIERARAQLAEVIEQAPFGIAVTGPDGQPRFANRAWHDLGGEPNDVPAVPLAPPPEALEALGRGEAWSGEQRGGRVLRTRWFPVRRADGGVDSLIAFGEDRSRHRAIERALMEAHDHVEQALQAKAVFLSHISHEMRTPLNAIIGFSELMRAEVFGPLGAPHYRQYMDDIWESGQALLRMIEDVLEYTRMDDSVFQAEEAVVDVDEALARAVASLPQDERLDRLFLSGDQPRPLLLASPRAIERMLHSLILNVLRHAGRDAALAVRLTVDARNGAALSVADTGTGIDAGRLARLAEPFSCVDDAFIRGASGAGLGLVMVRVLVERHDGTMEIDSAPSQGTRVTLRFPPHRVLKPDRVPALAEG